MGISIRPSVAKKFEVGRRLVAFVLSLLLLSGSIGGLAEARVRRPFDEVPAGTWSYAVIDYFAARGWVDDYPGDLYVSRRTLTRYELALLGSQIVKRAATAAGWTLSAQELQWLQLFVKEYAGELSWLGYRLEVAGEPLLTPLPGALPPGSSAGGEGFIASDQPGQDLRLDGSFAPPHRGLTGARIPHGGFLGHRALGPGADVAAVAERVARRLARLATDGSERSPAVTASALRLEAGGLNGDRGIPAEGARRPGGWTPAAESREEVRSGRPDILFGARATLSVVERAPADWVNPTFPSPNEFDKDSRDLRSYDLVLDLGDVRLTSPRSSLRRGLEAWTGRSGGGPVAFSSGVTSVVPSVQTGNWALYEEVKDLGTTTASRAGLGMDLFIPAARLRLGWRYEGELDNRLAWGNGTTVADVEYQIDSRAHALAGIMLSDEERGTTRTTQLGLRYSLGRDASLLLGYRLIDFGKLRDQERDDPLTKMATAEFSLRF